MRHVFPSVVRNEEKDRPYLSIPKSQIYDIIETHAGQKKDFDDDAIKGIKRVWDEHEDWVDENLAQQRRLKQRRWD